MMSEREYRALVAILNRAPVSEAEALWVNELLARLAAEIKKAKVDHAHLD